MADQLVRRETPVEYFREQVDEALRRQRLRSSEWTAYYLVNLLSSFVSLRRDGTAGFDDGPLGVRLVEALQASGPEQREALRRVGDSSLFISGFFAESLSRRLVDVDYYVSLGGSAYARLARRDDDAFADVFAELSEKFVAFVDVLSEVSERSALSSNADLLRLYDRWVRTRSRRDGDRLAERGLVPNATAGRSIQ